jgi:hypothetical protein
MLVEVTCIAFMYINYRYYSASAQFPSRTGCDASLDRALASRDVPWTLTDVTLCEPEHAQ